MQSPQGKAKLKQNLICAHTHLHWNSKINLYTQRNNTVFFQRLIMFLIQVKSPRFFIIITRRKKTKQVWIYFDYIWFHKINVFIFGEH